MFHDLIFRPVYANCPVCIITVGGGLFIAKELGIDDLLVSIWISGLNTAIAFWLAGRIKKKYFRSPLLWSFSFYILTIITLVLTKQIGHPQNIFLGVDKIFFGMTLGLFVFLLSFFIDKYLRKINKGKVLFYYQKVIIPVLFLSLVTFIMAIVIKK